MKVLVKEVEKTGETDKNKLDLALCKLLRHYENLLLVLTENMKFKDKLVSQEMANFIINEDINFNVDIANRIKDFTEKEKLQYIEIVADKICQAFNYLEVFLTF